MPKAKGANEIDRVCELFPAGSAKMVERLLKRAADKRAREALRGAPGAGGGRAGRKLGSYLAGQLAKAVSQRGGSRPQAASSRQKAPDTGGRPFHFAHSTVNKADRAGKAAAHTRYIERPGAVEEASRERDAGKAREEGREGAAREVGEGRGLGDRVATLDGGMGSAEAGQGYIENPAKLANGERILASFGTIGETFDDRVAFWEALEASENANARVQCRLVLELPHEASPQARHDMMRAFCRRFEDGGLPYWAALHAPGKENDARNYHCHVVYSEAPARRMVDPKDGRTKWDFEIKEVFQAASRNWRERWPHKQKRDPFFRKMTAIKELRREFAKVVNEVLVRDGVRDRDGGPVLYDHRSYADMGLDVVPMRSINRIVADKVKGGRLTVLDADYTRKIVAAEIRAAVARRDKGVLEMIALDRTLEEMAKAPGQPSRFNARLPREMKASPAARMTRKAVEVAGRAILRARHEALAIDVMGRSTVASLERIVEATDGEVLAASIRNTRDPARREALPDPEAARLLREAAREELAETQASLAKARASARYKLGAAINGWRDLVGAEPTAAPVASRGDDRVRPRGREDGKRERETGRPEGKGQAEAGLGAASVRGQGRGPEGGDAGGAGKTGAASVATGEEKRRAGGTEAGERTRGGSKVAKPARRPATGAEPVMPVMPTMPTPPSLGRMQAASKAASAIIAAVAAMPKEDRLAVLAKWGEEARKAAEAGKARREKEAREREGKGKGGEEEKKRGSEGEGDGKGRKADAEPGVTAGEGGGSATPGGERTRVKATVSPPAAVAPPAATSGGREEGRAEAPGVGEPVGGGTQAGEADADKAAAAKAQRRKKRKAVLAKRNRGSRGR